MWPSERIQHLFGTELPIIQAPMAGAVGSEMVISVCEAGGLGSLPCAMLDPDQMRAELGVVRQRTARPFNVNFFCHEPPEVDEEREKAWQARLRPYYEELGVDLPSAAAGPARMPFGEAQCSIVEEFAPPVVSFHFGLPEQPLLERVRRTGARIIASATSVAEAQWLADGGCDAVVAQGFEAGGHSGMFLTRETTGLVGTMALVPQVVDAVEVPVIAAGGIADGRGIAAAFKLGASAVQIGTAYLRCDEAFTHPLHRNALEQATADQTALTNVFTGRPARGVVNRLMREVGPISSDAPQFPLAATEMAPLQARAREVGTSDFLPLWAGQGVGLARTMPARELTRELADEALALL